MADDRIATIIKEIQYWKEHKLLPEVQCDFLLALYTQGNGEVTKRKAPKNSILYIQLFLLVMMVPFSFLVVYFTQFNSILQLGILLAFIGYATWIFLLYNKRKNVYRHLAIIIFLAMILITSDFLSTTVDLNQLFTVLVILLNFVGWYLLGRSLHLKYLKIASVLALIIVLFVNFSHLFSFN
ncbi:hypothetical protein [Ornithinibacillus xuwenensis]|uniref:DUF1129 domain-containing protein n=1 Tax=Ornithinibacillus xuwenensis TaxID=3144668 RepID=A0ABU9XEJ7_9BACI